jgi:hypothetical protein
MEARRESKDGLRGRTASNLSHLGGSEIAWALYGIEFVGREGGYG